MKLYHNFNKLNGFLIAIHLCLFLPFLISLYCFLPKPYAQNTQEIKKQLLKKGITEDVLNLLTPRCLESLNRKLPGDTVWYATYDSDAKSVTVDFQYGLKPSHNSITVVSLKNGGCMTVQNSSVMSIGPCKIQKEWWIGQLKEIGVNLKTIEESEKRIYLGTEGNIGIKIFLYTAGNLCMEVYRNVEIIK